MLTMRLTQRFVPVVSHSFMSSSPTVGLALGFRRLTAGSAVGAVRMA